MKRLSIALLACLATSVAGAAGAPIVRGVGNGIYHSPPLNHDVQQTVAGTSINFVSGDFDDTGPISGDWDTNFWDDDGFALYNISTYNVVVAVDGTGNALLLQPGDTVGAASTFSDTGGTTLTEDAWLAGVDGYLGYKFDCDGRLVNPVPSGFCYGYVHVVTGDANGFPATIVEYSYDGDGNDIVVAPAGPPVPSASKAFAPATVGTGVSSTLTITLTNPTATAATLTADLVDTFPSGLVVASTPNASTTCGGAVTANAGDGAVTLGATGSTIPASGACAIAVDVSAADAGAYANTIPAGALQTDQGNSAIAANATLNVSGAPSATVTPSSLSITAPADGNGTATLNIANAAGADNLTFAITAQAASHTILHPHARTSRAAAKKAMTATRDPMLVAKLQGRSLRTPASFTAGTHAHSVRVPWAPAGSIQFQLDDGSAETAISLNDGSTQTQSAYMNRFTVTPGTGAFTIDSISIFWPGSDLAGGDLTGLQVNLVAWYDVDGDGDPSNAVRLGGDDLVTIDSPGSVQTYTTSFSVPGDGDIYVGFVDTFAGSPPLFSTAMDTDSSAHSSFVAANPGAGTPPDLDNLGNNEALGVIDDITGGALAGNWLIRATGSGGGSGGCTGTPVPWLTATPSGGSVAGGANTNVTVKATPADGSLTPGSYSAELCIATNDPAQAVITIPVSVTVTAGDPCSAADTLFCDGFDGSGSGNDDVVTGTIDADVQDDGDGSTFDFVTGVWGVYDAGRIDDINLYNFGDGMYVYWYGDAVSLAVGGVVDSGGVDFAVLESGDTIGPDSVISAGSIAMTNWIGGADGYIGIAFQNEDTGALNYGYIHMTTSSPDGFPAHAIEYAYNRVGDPITIP
ncbi:MAG TPA: hypothetical protein VFV97_05005 [Rhodanobacteraceae bacterium]|nr:hypothetical protein [Rhodanobacteraceae bacterium]